MLNWIMLGGSLYLALLFSGVLYRVFLNVLLTAMAVTLTAWIGVLLLGFGLFVALPLYCGATGRDLEMTLHYLFFEDGIYQSMFSSRS